ncbi:unnamed protein product [Haemonchus placei]|uniref:RUN domain-containing protein n=1 Tax=Haemonchus placei TaxID=6290 RepID=A0A0N4W922_HAEPC|nr:unnamed protein product [Haemonchus placei]
MISSDRISQLFCRSGASLGVKIIDDDLEKKYGFLGGASPESCRTRIWHYTGVLLEEELYDTPNEELWEDRDSFATKAVEAAQRVTTYVPPHLRKVDNSHAKQQSNGKQQNTVKMTEAEKKTLAIKKKLRDIEVLKARLSNGEELQKTQLEKIAKEPELIAQLAAFEEVH